MSYENEEGYLEILKDVLKNGQEINTRNGITISNFGYLLKFNNINNFPLLTTKRVYFKGVLEELLWFLKGSSNTDYLQQKNIHIWDGNSSREYLDANGFENYKEGELGPVYGWQWRSYGKKYNKFGDENGVDQIKYVLEELLKSNNSRRAVLNAWNPSQLNEMALPPCHMMYNFYKNNDGLSCLMTMRSSDLFLGLPFNIASTALLTSIIAKVLHLNVNNIALSLCDAHIYKEHVNAVNEQLSNDIIDNNCFLKINKEAPDINTSVLEKINWINNLESNDFEIINYKSHNTIKAIMK
jgi:dihydrofolate reductase/thymidylate synthase